MAKRLDNIGFVKKLMTETCGGNPLAQAFIIDAIGKLADTFADADPDKLDASGQWGLVSPYAWVDIAKDIKRQLAERNKG